ncbi:amidase family protein [Penicillium frequentans]|nr:amidase family protein [Penicillium glabrum]
MSVSEYSLLNTADSAKHLCGSLAGSATAVAAGFVPLALGTETRQSISCSASTIVLYVPKVFTGALSRNGNMPTSTTFGSPGTLVKSAWDFAALLTDIKGVDPKIPSNLSQRAY